MSDVQIYLKPRPISSVYGHSNYLPFQWNPDFKYGPFFAGYGTIPSDATEVYIIHSPDLSAGIAAFHNELIPSLQDEPPDPEKASRSSWPNIYELGIAKLKPVTQFLQDSEDHINQLYYAPFSPPLQAEDGPEWHKLFFSILARRDVEFCHGDNELEIFVWAYLHYMVFYVSLPWNRLGKEMYRRMEAYITNTPFSAEGSLSIEAYRANALVFPSMYTTLGNTDDQRSSVKFSKNDRGVPICNGDSCTVAPAFLLRRRNRSMAPNDADLA
ncbi:hypothetical protein EV421DRAFT_1769605 [Armillaria borealis]|uniref:Uncharacterized protein n=1 Tax=Armillaria borealis TaxID=47425 RepID=A0AA39K0Y1_9AGAR|nr:hypothetical protein EV421DRAFT_1769605 [Armillaria borealis]